MKKKPIIRTLALALCLVLALSACSLPFDFPFDFFGGGDAAEVEKPERRTIPYDEMEYTRPDTEALLARMAELTEALGTAEDFDAVMALDDEVGDLQEEFAGMNSLAMLKKYHDMNDGHWEEEYRYLEEAKVDLSLAVNDFNQVLVDGPFSDDYRDEVGDYVFQSIENELLLNSPTVEKYKKERNALAVDYNNMLSELSYTYEGKDYTLQDVYSADSEVLYYALMDGLYNQNAEDFTDIYAQMVELDKATALELGFESPAHMYYLAYGRDYGPEEAQTLCDNIKDIFGSIAPFIQYSAYMMSESPAGAEQAAVFEAMPDALTAVDPELAEAWAFMEQYGLVDADPLDTKQQGVAFTTEINQYDAPFFFMNWDAADFRSASTVTHEFGHFYDFWLRYGETVTSSLDVAEVYSQALELLMHEQYPSFTETVDAARLDNLADMAVSAVTYQAMLEEFQLRAYELDTFDAAILGQLYAELEEDYGLNLSVTVDEKGADNTWFAVTHLFDSPFYTISYSVSCLAALQIWAESQQDWDDAADTYLELIHADQNQPFSDLMKDAGLRDVHNPGAMAEIAGYFEEAFQLQELYAQMGAAA